MTEILMQVFMAFLGTLGFSILFGAPKRLWGWCGFTGIISWGIYLVIGRHMGMPVVGTFVSAFLLTVVCRYMSVLFRTSTTVFLVCGIFPLVPGAAVYYTAYNVVIGMNVEALEHAVDCMKLALSIGIGIGAGYSLPGKMFGWHLVSDVWNEN